MISEIGVDKPLPYSTKCGLPLLQKMENLRTFEYYPSLKNNNLRRELEKFIILNIKPDLKNQDFFRVPKDVLLRDKEGRTGKSMLIHKICHEMELPAYFVRIDTLISDTVTMTIENIRRIISFGITCDCVVVFQSIQLLHLDCVAGLMYLLKNTRHNCVYLLEYTGDNLPESYLTGLDLICDMPTELSGTDTRDLILSFLFETGIKKRILTSMGELQFKDLVGISEVLKVCEGLILEFCMNDIQKFSPDRLKGISCLQKLLK